MSYILNNQQKINEIIFAGRNKSYGAYEIRSSYGNTVFKSIGFMLLGFGTFVSIAYLVTNHDVAVNKETFIIHDSIFVIPFNIEEPKTDPPARPDNPPPRRDVVGADSRNSTVVADSSSTVETFSTTSLESITSTLTNVATETGGSGTSTTIALSTKGSGPGPNDIRGSFEVDSQPEFEGGLKALYAFVSKHLHYPEVASIEGKGGTVYVKFVVDENGKVINLSAQNSLGYGLEEEALRVVGMIPKFKTPAMANGHPVKVYFQLPIRFKYK